jgi:hypothetical protein
MYASYSKNDLKELYQKHKVKQTKLFIGGVIALVKCSVIDRATIGETSYIYATNYPEHVSPDDKIVNEIQYHLQELFTDIKVSVHNLKNDDETDKIICEINWG